MLTIFCQQFVNMLSTVGNPHATPPDGLMINNWIVGTRHSVKIWRATEKHKLSWAPKYAYCPSSVKNNTRCNATFLSKRGSTRHIFGERFLKLCTGTREYSPLREDRIWSTLGQQRMRGEGWKREQSAR